MLQIINKYLEKEILISYFRHRVEEYYSQISAHFAENDYKRRATELNKKIEKTYNSLCKNLLQVASKEMWNNKDILKNLLLITYTNYVVMLDMRNMIWKYDYMSFSRRIGELWEPFCKLCFYHSLKPLTLFIPPLFSDVKEMMSKEIEEFIDGLNILKNEKIELKSYYKKVWSMVTSGEIQLELDLHFCQNNKKYNIDFKSGFGSNEKGNTNRLLLVATIFKNIDSNYENLLLVRSREDENNQYFKRLKNSKIWSCTCYNDTYSKINDFTGFNIKKWIEQNMNWEADLLPSTIIHLKDNDLLKYLDW
jgi:hypothetical protein